MTHRSLTSLLASALALFVLVPRVSAQVVNPATAQTDAPAGDADGHLHTFEMPPVTVYGKASLREDDRIGDYEQPRWTADRLFGETRVYVVPKGKAEFEYWLTPTFRRDGTAEITSQYEMEFGLPGRLQLDVYAVAHKEGLSGPMAFSEQKVELRWALAKWGRLWGNPTLYAEWKSLDNQPDHFEGKLLLGGNLAAGWHWGSNLVWEHEMDGAKENSNEWTVGLSHTVRDAKFDLGVESKLALVNRLDGSGQRTPLTTEALLGPSLQIRFTPATRLDLAPLVGLTNPAARSKILAVFGYEF